MLGGFLSLTSFFFNHGEVSMYAHYFSLYYNPLPPPSPHAGYQSDVDPSPQRVLCYAILSFTDTVCLLLYQVILLLP